MTYLLAGCLWFIGQCVTMVAAAKGEPQTCAEGVVFMLLGASLTLWRTTHGAVSYLSNYEPQGPADGARVHGNTPPHTASLRGLCRKDTSEQVSSVPPADTEAGGYADHDEHGYDSRGVERSLLEVSRGMGCRTSGEGRTNPGETEVAT